MPSKIIQNLIIPEEETLVETIIENWGEVSEECIKKGYFLDLTHENYLIIDGCSDLNFVKYIEEFLLGGHHKKMYNKNKFIGYVVK